VERNASRSAAVPAAASESLDVRRRPHRDFLPAKTLDEFACSQRFGEIDGEILVLDSVSSPITKRVYNMALDEFFGWVRPGAAARLHQGHRERVAGNPGGTRGVTRPIVLLNRDGTGNFNALHTV
jgi:hypothetical protein